jgi:hypothetical protein
MGDTAVTTLTVQQISDIINTAKSGGANPMLVGMQIFNTLGDNVTVPGDTLRLALTNTAVAIAAPLVPLVQAIQNISKIGNHLSLELNEDIETILNNNRMRFKQELSFDVIPTASAPGLTNILGVAAHKFVSWISIQSIHLKQNLGLWSVAVVTPVTTINFDLN